MTPSKHQSQKTKPPRVTITDSITMPEVVQHSLLEALKVDDAHTLKKLLQVESGSGSTVSVFLADAAFGGDLDRRTLLHHAAELNAKACAEFLVKSGWGLDVRDAAGNTPLLSATRAYHIELSDLFARWGADVKAQNKTGYSVLHLIAGTPDMSAWIQPFIEHGAQIEAKTTSSRQTPLHEASKWGNSQAASILLSLGASTDALNHAQQNPLALARINGSKDVVDLLEGWNASQAAKWAIERTMGTQAHAKGPFP
jgi:hypothetical protein